MKITSALTCCPNMDTIQNKVDKLSAIPIYLSLVIAIIGIIASFFTPYALLSVLPALAIGSGFGIYHARKSPILNSLQGKVEALNNVSNRLEHTNSKLSRTNDKLSLTNDKLETNINTFKEENKKLTSNVTQFEKSNISLGTHVTSLKEIATHAKIIISEFAIEREKLQGEVDRGVKNIDSLLETAEKLAVSTSTFINAHDDVRASVVELNETIKSATKEGVLEIKNAAIEGNKELVHIRTTIAYETQALQKEKKELALLREQFQKTQQDLAETEKKLRQRTEQLEKAADRLDHSVNKKLDQEKKGAPPLNNKAINIIVPKHPVGT
ncbi:MAG: hypothetical protein V4494_02755 [Chlamydiota bacterium]